MITSMNSDSIFAKGASHKICEAYCGHEGSTILVSDGCSSSKDTDIGARILVKTGLQNLKTTDDFSATITRAATVASLMGVGKESLDATLLFADYKKDEKCFDIRIHGDGTAILYYDNGSWVAFNISFEKEMPKYLSYNLNAQRRKQYLKEMSSSKAMIKTIYTFLQDSNRKVTSTKSYYPIHMNPYVLGIPSDRLKAIVLVTDGMETFMNKRREVLPLERVFTDLLNVKPWKGPFLQRRINRMLKNYKQEGYENFDDIGVAAINIEHYFPEEYLNNVN